MLRWSFKAVDYGANGRFYSNILEPVKSWLAPLNDIVMGVVNGTGNIIAKWDVTGFVSKSYDVARTQLDLEVFDPQVAVTAVAPSWHASASAFVIALFVYVIIGLVVAYVVSLFFSIQTTVYLLLRKAVDGAEMSEVYREEEEEDYLSITPEPEPGAEAPAEEPEEAPAEEKAKKPARKKTKKKEDTSD